MKCKIQIKHERNLDINGDKVRVARAEKGWTITEMADKSGVTRKTIGQIEKGSKKGIRFSTIQQIAESLGRPIEYFCTHKENKSEEAVK